MAFYNRHYIRVDAEGRIVDGFSDAFESPSDGDTCINDHGGYQFRLMPDGEENPLLLSGDGIPLYRWDGEKVVVRAESDVLDDRRKLDAAPLPVDPVWARMAEHEAALMELAEMIAGGI